MSFKGVLVFQLICPFILFLIGEFFWYINIATSTLTFGWIFGLILAMYVNKTITIVESTTNVNITIALSVIIASVSTARTDVQGRMLHIFVKIVLCVSWTRFLNAFDNSWENITIFLKSKWNTIFQIPIFIYGFMFNYAKTNVYDYAYDVLILLTDNDKKVITDNSIISSIEERKYAVCFPESDLDAGIPVLKLYSEAIKKSNTIIVVCSKDFCEDPFMCSIVFEISTISYKDGKLRHNDVLLIITDECEIPGLSKKRYECLDITQGISTESFTNRVCAWLETRIPQLDIIHLKTKIVFAGFLNFLSMVFLITILIKKNNDGFLESPLKPYILYLLFCSTCCVIFISKWLFYYVRLLCHITKRLKKKSVGSTIKTN